LSGAELKEVLRADFNKLLDAEGMLADRVAYGRCAYAIRLTLHTGNVYWPESTIETVSDRRGSVADVVGEGRIIPEKLPLENPSGGSSFGAQELSRSIDSPNAERLRTGMPVPVERRQADGTLITEHIKYPPAKDKADAKADAKVTIKDATATARKELHL